MNKKVKNATIEQYGEIKYKSKLEAYTARKLNEYDLPFMYESSKFVLMDKFRYENYCLEQFKKKGAIMFGEAPIAIRAITYTPDFVCIKDDVAWIIEVKGHQTAVFKIKWKMFKQHLQKRIDSGEFKSVNLYLPRNQKQVNKVINEINENFIKRD